MALAKALSALAQTRPAAEKSPAAARRLHLNYLETYAQLTEKPSLEDALQFLDHLRKARSLLATQGVSQHRLDRDCKQHEGFAKFRSQILGDELEKASAANLTRIYSNLRRMDLTEDATKLWPHVARRVLKGRPRRDELLRLWATCPPETLLELDGAMGKALEDGEAKAWQLLSVLSRSGNLPEKSKTLKVCLDHVTKMVEEFNMSPEDMATLLYRLHVASSRNSNVLRLKPLVVKIKEELVSRSPNLEVGSICRLLPCLDQNDEELWSLLRQQLLSKKTATKNAKQKQQVQFTLTNCLDILEFLPNVPRPEGKSASGEPELKGLVAQRLEFILSKGQAIPNDLALITRRLETVAPLRKVCQALMNLAINLRQDLYPAVLWRFFVRTGEAKLAEHQDLMPKFHRIGEILEVHGIQRDKMSLKEMLKSAEAMRRNKVKMPKCLDQMAQIFLEMLQHAQRHTGNVADEDDAPAEPVEDAKGPEAEASVQAALDAEQLPEEQVGSMSIAARKVLLAEVQYLVLMLWAEFERMAIQNEPLTEAALALCEPENCHLDTRRVVDCIVGLADVVNPAVKGKLRQLLFLEQVPDSELLEYLLRLSPDVETCAMVFEDLNRRLMEEKLQITSDSDREALLRCLSELQRNPQTQPEMIRKVATLLLEHLPSEKGHQATRRCRTLAASCAALSELEEDARPPLRPLLQQTLRRLKETPSLPSEELVQLLFALTALHGGRLPFDLASYAWALAAQHAGKVRSEPRTAKLWTFALCCRWLSRPSAWASMRLVPNADLLDASDQKLPSLAMEEGSQELLKSLRSALSSAVPGEFGETRYQVAGTPVVLDFALERLQLGILLVRPSHLCRGSETALNGTGHLLEALLKALGWRLLWAFPREVDLSTDQLAEALRYSIDSNLTSIQQLRDTSSIELAAGESTTELLGTPAEPAELNA